MDIRSHSSPARRRPAARRSPERTPPGRVVTGRARLRRAIALCLATSVLLAACGSDNDAPNPTATTNPAESTRVASPAGAPLVGQLADRIAAAWSDIASYRTTTNTLSRVPMPGSPVAAPAETRIVEEVIVPDRRRRVVTVNGEVRSELIVVDGEIYGRGPELPGLPESVADPENWVLIDPAELGDESQFRPFYETFATIPPAPYSDLTDQERGREARPVGTIPSEGRECDAYEIADTTLTGDRFEIRLSLDEQDLPCSIETIAGGTTTTTTFVYDIDLDIEAPEGVTS